MSAANEEVVLSPQREDASTETEQAGGGQAQPQAPAAEAPPSGAQISPQELLVRRRNAQVAYVFDLRSPEEFEAGHVPGAYNLPYQHLEANLHRLPFAGDLLFHDGGEGLARQALALLEDNGFTDCYFIEDGYEALMETLRNAPEEVHFESLSPQEQADKIEAVLDAKVRDFLANDGGGLEVMGIDGARVLVSYQGACGSCASSTTGTLHFIQSTLTLSLNHEIEVVPVDG